MMSTSTCSDVLEPCASILQPLSDISLIENPSNNNELLLLGSWKSDRCFRYKIEENEFVSLYTGLRDLNPDQDIRTTTVIKGMEPDTVIVIGHCWHGRGRASFYSILNTKIIGWEKIEPTQNDSCGNDISLDSKNNNNNNNNRRGSNSNSNSNNRRYSSDMVDDIIKIGNENYEQDLIKLYDNHEFHSSGCCIVRFKNWLIISGGSMHESRNSFSIFEIGYNSDKKMYKSPKFVTRLELNELNLGYSFHGCITLYENYETNVIELLLFGGHCAVFKDSFCKIKIDFNALINNIEQYNWQQSVDADNLFTTTTATTNNNNSNNSNNGNNSNNSNNNTNSKPSDGNDSNENNESNESSDDSDNNSNSNSNGNNKTVEWPMGIEFSTYENDKFIANMRDNFVEFNKTFFKKIKDEDVESSILWSFTYQFVFSRYLLIIGGAWDSFQNQEIIYFDTKNISWHVLYYQDQKETTEKDKQKPNVCNVNPRLKQKDDAIKIDDKEERPLSQESTSTTATDEIMTETSDLKLKKNVIIGDNDDNDDNHDDDCDEKHIVSLPYATYGVASVLNSKHANTVHIMGGVIKAQDGSYTYKDSHWKWKLTRNIRWKVERIIWIGFYKNNDKIDIDILSDYSSDGDNQEDDIKDINEDKDVILRSPRRIDRNQIDFDFDEEKKDEKRICLIPMLPKDIICFILLFLRDLNVFEC